MKVRLVRPLVAKIAHLDTVAIEAINPPGTATSGYHPDFKEPMVAKPDLLEPESTCTRSRL